LSNREFAGIEDNTSANYRLIMANDKLAACFARLDYQYFNRSSLPDQQTCKQIILLYEGAGKRYTGGVNIGKPGMSMQFVWN
jgi:hypothetical protein